MHAPVTDVVVTMVQYRQVAIEWLVHATPPYCRTVPRISANLVAA
jgi:hypothetical protein